MTVSAHVEVLLSFGPDHLVFRGDAARDERTTLRDSIRHTGEGGAPAVATYARTLCVEKGRSECASL